MSTVIQIQHDASITTVTKPTVRHIYSAQITERTATKIQTSHLFTLLTVIHLPQPCLSPVSNHFSRKCVSYVRQMLRFALIKDESKACASAGIYVIKQRTVSLAGKHATHYTGTWN